jgi:hypothetical protein
MLIQAFCKSWQYLVGTHNHGHRFACAIWRLKMAPAFRRRAGRRRIDDQNPVHPVERYRLDSPIDKRLGKITTDWLV